MIFFIITSLYNVKWLLLDLDSGVHHVEIRATLDAQRMAGSFNLDAEKIALDETYNIISAVFIDQGLAYAEPIHIMNDDNLK